MDMPYRWTELTAIPGVEDPQKLAWKICASFSIPAVRSKVFLGQGYTAPPAPKCLTWNVFLPNELSYQDVWQQPFLLTVAYTQGLQYWAERLNPPVDPDFCPLVRSVLELRERVKEHIVFSKQDIIRDLGRIDPGTMSLWPQLISEVQTQALLGPRRHVSPLPHHFNPSLTGDTPWFPQPGFKWRTDWLGKMQALLRQPLKLPLPPCQGSNWPVQSPHPIGQKRKTSMYWLWLLW